MKRHTFWRAAPWTAGLFLGSAFLGSAFLGSALLGCANPGPPRPPSLHLPRVVTDLTATRVGDSVRLGWTTPAKTTDEVPVQTGMRAGVCRGEIGPGAALTCLPLVLAQPGATTFEDALPAELTRGAARLLRYRVRMLNESGRSAGMSAPAYAEAGPKLAAVADLRPTAIERGVRLEWRAATPGTVELKRTTMAVPVTARARAKGTDAESAAGRQAEGVGEEIELRVEARTAEGGKEGAVDRSVAEGGSYRYTVERVRREMIFGHAVTMRSEPSAAVTVSVRDLFAPRAPVGLAAAVTMTVTDGRASIDLSWEPGAEPDLAGYVVERKELGAAVRLEGGVPTAMPAQATPGSEETSGSFVRLTAHPVTAPAYRDREVTAGIRYAYRILAVDRSGNESLPGAAVEASMPKP